MLYRFGGQEALPCEIKVRGVDPTPNPNRIPSCEPETRLCHFYIERQNSSTMTKNHGCSEGGTLLYANIRTRAFPQDHSHHVPGFITYYLLLLLE